MMLRILLFLASLVAAAAYSPLSLSASVDAAVSSIDAPIIKTTLSFRGGGKEDHDHFSAAEYKAFKEWAAGRGSDVAVALKRDGTGYELRFVKRDQDRKPNN
jgi:hypothetical protein